MPKRALNYSILIICEGQNTEPSYFDGINTVIQSEHIWPHPISLTIIPKPKKEEDDDPNDSRHKSKRKKRTLIKTGIRVRRKVEDKYSSEPTCFVREAQLEKSDGTYNETWVVFDNDTRNLLHLKQAFALANNAGEGIVHIAYSSICFEHWILLHFEPNCQPFVKSECRIKDIILDCNAGTHPDDCFGSKCIGGYLRNRGFITDTKGKKSIFPMLRDKLEFALINASFLRAYMANTFSGMDMVELNPYTTIDILVKRLLQIDRQYTWHAINSIFPLKHIQVQVKQDTSTIEVKLTNKSTQTLVLPPKTIQCLNEKLEVLNSSNRMVLGVDMSSDYRFSIHANATNILAIEIGNETVLVLLEKV